MIIPSTLHVLYLASEADPFIKIGGLGDVAGSLPLALRNLREHRVDVRLVIPFHGSLRYNEDDIHLITDLIVPHREGPIPAQVFKTSIQELPVYLISGPPIPRDMPVYSNNQKADVYKYIFFSLAALQLSEKIGFRPHILHANDWHTAAAVYALAIRNNSAEFFKSTASLLQIHNLPYLGEASSNILDDFGLPAGENFQLPYWAQTMLLPLGLLTADHIVTVSPTYAKEILTPEFGSGLQDFLSTRSDSISGILNGIDTEYWNPETDPHIKINYTAESIKKRTENKHNIQKESGLKIDTDTPLIGMITRMDYQKGMDLAISGLHSIKDMDWQAVVLGSGKTKIERDLYSLASELPEKFRAIIRFDSVLSRKIYAGADILLMPSRYEPCGLAQMIAMHYGCVPVARATGGLKDTIQDDPTLVNSTGFLFKQNSGEALAESLKRAFDVYKQKDVWSRLQSNGMHKDFSWERSAGEYLGLYESMITAKR